MNHIIIGKNTIINGKKYFSASKYSKINIGKYCAIADNLNIITLNHDYNYPCLQGTFYKKLFNNLHPGELNIPPNKERTKGGIIIGNDVCISKDVFILSGVTIGDGVYIGARSIVTRDLPPYTICVGNPCRVVKKRYSDSIINFLLNIKWWNWDDDKIKKNKDFFYCNLNTKKIDEIEKLIKT